MERADWLQAGMAAAQARFLMVTAITHHSFSSPAWGVAEVRKLHAELAEIDAAAMRAIPVSRVSRASRARPAARSLTAGPALHVGPALMARQAGHAGRPLLVMRPAGYLPLPGLVLRFIRGLRSVFRQVAREAGWALASASSDRPARPLTLGPRDGDGGMLDATRRQRSVMAGRRDWRDRAACRDLDPELFFPISTMGAAVTQVEAATQICRRCPVRLPCLRWALETGQDAGIWGGLTEEERRILRHRPAR